MLYRGDHWRTAYSAKVKIFWHNSVAENGYETLSLDLRRNYFFIHLRGNTRTAYSAERNNPRRLARPDSRISAVVNAAVLHRQAWRPRSLVGCAHFFSHFSP